MKVSLKKARIQSATFDFPQSGTTANLGGRLICKLDNHVIGNYVLCERAALLTTPSSNSPFSKEATSANLYLLLLLFVYYFDYTPLYSTALCLDQGFFPRSG